MYFGEKKKSFVERSSQLEGVVDAAPDNAEGCACRIARIAVPHKYDKSIFLNNDR